MIYSDNLIKSDQVNGKHKISENQIGYQSLLKNSIDIIHNKNYVHNKQEKNTNFKKIRLQTKDFPKPLFSLNEMDKNDITKPTQIENPLHDDKSHQKRETSFTHKLKMLNNITKRNLKPKSENNSRVNFFNTKDTLKNKIESQNNTFYNNKKELSNQKYETSKNSYEQDYKLLQKNFDKHSDNSIIEYVHNSKNLFDQFDIENEVNDKTNNKNTFFIQRSDNLIENDGKKDNKKAVKKYVKPDLKILERTVNEFKKKEIDNKMSGDGKICDYMDFVNKDKLIISFYQEQQKVRATKTSNFHRRSFSEKVLIPEKSLDIKHVELETFNKFKEKNIDINQTISNQNNTHSKVLFDKTNSRFKDININDQIKHLHETLGNLSFSYHIRL